jgi:hypothetical protein
VYGFLPRADEEPASSTERRGRHTEAVHWNGSSSSPRNLTLLAEVAGNTEEDGRGRGRGASVGVLDRQTYQGGTRGSRLCGGDRDRETENSKLCARTQNTRFIQVRVAKVANPTSCLEIKYGALRLVLVEIRCPTRYPTLLYIVQGASS